MKRVSITFLSDEPVINRPEVIKTPSYTSFNYATADSKSYFVTHAEFSFAGQPFPARHCHDITFFLTSPPLYISVGNSRILNKPFKMWTRTTSVKNNKRRFVTLITPLNKFATITVSASSNHCWYQFQPGKVSKVSNTANK